MAAINALLGSDLAPSLKAMASDCKLGPDKLNRIDIAAGKSAQLAARRYSLCGSARRRAVAPPARRQRHRGGPRSGHGTRASPVA